jgi:PAS domain S-box-containing protein
MERAKGQLAVTLRDVGDGVVTTDPERRVVLLNKKAEEMTGWTIDEVRGRPLLDVLPWSGQCSGGTKVPSELHVEDRWGRKLWISVTLSEMEGAILSFQDITRRKEDEENRFMASKMESLSLVAAGIAHDFNNLLTVIRGHASLVKEAEGLDTETFASMEGIEEATVSAMGLANQLLTFAQGGAPVKEAQSVADVLSESLSFILAGSGMKLVKDLPPDLWWAELDAKQIGQVFHNLASNALEATGGRGELRVMAENLDLSEPLGELPKGRYVRVRLTDDGNGIPAGIMAKVFDPYFTTKAEGTGLGLTTSYSVVARHQGRLELASQEGGGTTVTIYLPASAVVPAATPKADPKKTSPKGGRILVMDDEPGVLRVLDRMLVRLGFEVTPTTRGEEALEAYRQALSSEPFRCVILDLTVPGGMGGQETLIELRKLDPDVVAIVASGYAAETVMADYKKWGFDVRLPKPFGLSQLEHAMGEALSLVEPRQL